jgi:integrase
VVTTNPAKSNKARETLGKPKVKIDVLQREQLAAWFDAVRQIGNPVISAYLQCLLLTGARREEMARLRWVDVDFQWNSMKLNDKIEEFRMVPLTPYVSCLMAALPRRNDWVFSSTASESGRLAEPRIAHNEAIARAGLPPLTLHGLRRSFASLCEWIETPTGISAQIQGHAPQGVREQNYIRRPLDLLRMWHVKIEAWMLEEAGVASLPLHFGLRVVSL